MRPRFAILLVPFLAAIALASCSGETEGQPCDRSAGNSGNDDCASGLVCTQVSTATGSRCCPQDRTTAKSPDCQLSATTDQDANPEPVESSTSESSTSDAGEASTEAGPEGSTSDGPTGGAPAEGASEASTGDATGDAAGD
ncbi:MAG TPA: hypothetical protein VGG39_05595 [Polyangiaceae bacterium]|jgi:hypothetical protein